MLLSLPVSSRAEGALASCPGAGGYDYGVWVFAYGYVDSFGGLAGSVVCS